MAHTIDKQIDFCFGHRVWTQNLDAKFSIDDLCKCRHVHGHQGTIKIGLEAKSLEKGMVTDFKHLNCIKKLVDDYFDHRFIIDQNDPLFYNMFPEVQECGLVWHESNLFATPDMSYFKDVDVASPIYEKLEGLVVVDFVPTSENLCKFLATLTDFTLTGLDGYGTRFRLSHIDYWKHLRVTADTLAKNIERRFLYLLSERSIR